MITIDMADYRSRQNVPYDINEALTQRTYYLDEKDRYISVQTEVIGVHKILSVYVPRRKTSVVQRQSVGQNSIMSSLITFNQLPLTISGLSELNSYPVIAPPALRIGSYTLRKRSSLVVEVIPYAAPNDQTNVVELVTSTSAIIYNKDDNTTYYYNPSGVVSTITAPGAAGAAAQVGRPDPIVIINQHGSTDGSDLNANYLESRQGTLFFYQTTD
jgi:hypothetical protein